MLTYQDFLKVGDSEEDRMAFVKRAIQIHKNSDIYKTAIIAQEYDRHENRTIKQLQKFITDAMGRLVPDEWSANFKLPSRFFNRFVVQENQYLLGNGVTWEKPETKQRLGVDFDTQLQKAGKKALVGGVSFGFFNVDHLEVFGIDEYVPLPDENNGAMMAGIRYWQIDIDKPLRATLYEIDGYTEYIWNKKVLEDGTVTIENEVLQEKRPYIYKTVQNPVGDTEIIDGKNYPTFPIVPLWANDNKQSEIVGLREQIDCYDLIKSGYANNVDEASIVYWTLENAGGMDDVDVGEFVDKLRRFHAAKVDDKVTVTPNKTEAPYESREALLEKIRADLYEDAMALDVKNIANGAVTATQIEASYNPLDLKCNEYEYQVIDFLHGILSILEIDDTPTFTRSMIINRQEEASIVLQSASYLPDDYVITKLLTLLGDGDRAEQVIGQVVADEIERGLSDGRGTQGNREDIEEDGEGN